jgi:hypothetical protein
VTSRAVYKAVAARLQATIEVGSNVAKTNDLDRLVGAIYSPKEVKRILGQAARRYVYSCRINNTDPVAARHHVESSLRAMCEERGYVRFGVNKTVGNILGKVMTGYKAGYDLLQPQLEKAKERYERHERSVGRWRYWDIEMKEAFLRRYWGSEPG